MDRSSGSAVRCFPGGIGWLLRLVEEHKTAITYDFQTRFTLDADGIGTTIKWRRAINLIKGLLDEQGSHLHASINEWSYPMSMETMINSELLSTVKNALRPQGEKPFVIPWPWPATDQAPDVTAEERAAIHASLDSRSAFGQIRQN